MLHPNKQENISISLKKHCITGLLLEKLNTSIPMEDKEDILLKTMPIITKQISSTQELVQKNNQKIYKDKLISSQKNLITLPSFRTSVVDSIITESVFNESYEKLLKEVSIMSMYPIPIVSHASLSTSLNGSLNILEQNLLLFPNQTFQKIPMNLNLLKTSLESLHIIPPNIMEKENTLKLIPPTEPRQQTLKIRFYPNAEQKNKFNQFFDIYRLVYNTSVSLIKEHSKTNFIFIRSKMFEHINQKYNNPDWFNNLYFDSKTLAVKEASNAFVSNYAKGKSFKVKYKSKYNLKQNLKIDHRVPKIKNDILKIFKMDLYVRKFDMKKLKKIFDEYDISDSEIIREYPNKYSLILNYKTETQIVEKKMKRISIDPGIKTLSTIYSKEGILLKLGNNIQQLYKNKSEKINRLNEILGTKKGKTKKNIRKRISKLRSQIRNIVMNSQNTISNIIARSTEEVILPKLDVSNIISKAKRNINKNVVKDIIYKSPYKLHQKILDQCKKYNTRVIEVDERNTSITCGNCNNKKEKGELKGSRMYECKKCGIKIDRDYNGARNIMLKYDNLLEI